jgi:outer membrane protein OmpA-like peptidoglycan-associated protein
MNGRYPNLTLMLCTWMLGVCCACGGRRGHAFDPGVTLPHAGEERPNSTPDTAADEKRPEVIERPRPIADGGRKIAAARVSMSAEEYVAKVNEQLQDIFFSYDRSELPAEGLGVARRDAEILMPALSELPQVKVSVEGHCDERGSAEYNLGLGDRRAARIAAALGEFGVPAARVEIISYGKEAPQCAEPAEPCWRRNRRVHLVLR